MPHITIPKFEERAYSEDASLSDDFRLAVSDGAGGCGIFAERWSAYLLENLPLQPLTNYLEFSRWIDSIWENFFEENKVMAASVGGFAQNKFYEEGSYATLAAAWTNENKVHWMAYGDSVVFHYNRKTRVLEHSFTELSDFAESPWLINWKEETKPEGFRSGEFEINKYSVVFIASDALAFYLLAAYLIINHSEANVLQIEKAISSSSQHSMILKNLMVKYSDKKSFAISVLNPLLKAAHEEGKFKRLIKQLYKAGLMANDDYSIAWFDLKFFS